MPSLEQRAADIRASAPPGTIMFNLEGAVGAAMVIEDVAAAIKRKLAARKLRKYGLVSDQILVPSREVAEVVSLGLPDPAAATLIWSDRASRAGAYQAIQEPTPKHPGGTTEIRYADLTPALAREVDQAMRHSSDSPDHT